jgi:sec-independent protein translocase protein TatA
VSVGPWQLLIIVFVILLLFGGTRLSEIGKGLGEGIRNFKKGLSDDDRKADEMSPVDEPDAPKQLPSPPTSSESTLNEKGESEKTETAADVRDSRPS